MREVTDLEISAGIRRELSSRRVDLGKLKFAVSGGVVTFTGELAFIGLGKSPDEIAVEIKFIESTLRMQRGVKELRFDLENLSRSDSGKWEPRSAGTSAAQGTGEGFHCPECQTVFRFCPCCGKPLVAGLPAQPPAHRPGLPGPTLLKPLPRRIEPLRPAPLKPVTPLPVPPSEPPKMPVTPLDGRRGGGPASS
ncbi:MAG TPA: hypothetical protein PLP29_07715, partial [Candidatus Ozemobacteraceae bacterium]|nr:hypothetical protein [Candidatus Ozemobacteraceae bacterium]